MKKLKKITKIIIINNYGRQQSQRKKQYELNKRRILITKQNESNKQLKQNERKQKSENIVEDNDIGRFFEIATTNKTYVNGLNL